MPGCAAYPVRSTLTSLPLGFTLRKWERKKGPSIGWSRVLSYNQRSQVCHIRLKFCAKLHSTQSKAAFTGIAGHKCEHTIFSST